VRLLLCSISKNQSKANTRHLKFEPLQGFVHKIDRKLPISGRLEPLRCITINKENFFTMEVNLFGAHPDSTVSMRGGRTTARAGL
jgi:hypothetical protein